MRIGHIELRVADPMASKDFYESVLGFEVVSIQEERFVWLKLGEQEILLRPVEAGAEAGSFAAAEKNIVLYSGDLNHDREQLESRGLQFRGDDQGCLLFTDMDGHWYQLVEME